MRLSHRYFPDTLANEQLNMVWDGIFHFITWTMTAIGLSLLWRRSKQRQTFLASGVIMIAVGTDMRRKNMATIRAGETGRNRLRLFNRVI